MKAYSLICILLCIVLLVSCSPTNENSRRAEKTAQWLAVAKLDAYETPDELYKAALNEDTLQIYSNTTRVLEVKKSFENKYPGLVVEVVDIRDGDIQRLLIENYQNETYFCDVVICTDNNGIMSSELIPRGIIHKYVPHDIADKILLANNKEDLVILNEAEMLAYNTEAYDSPPISNWWELTEPRFRDKVYLPSPQKSSSIYSFFSMVIKNSDLMAESYEKLYGKSLEIPSNSDAGREFIRMLIKNGIKLTNSNGEVAEAIGMPGQIDPPVGIMISSKTRLSDVGYKLALAYQFEPFTGTYSPNSLMMVNGAKNVNSAKLFTRWILGETDGTGEGYKPYLRYGIWSARTDVKSQEQVPLEDMNFLSLDKEYAYNNYEEFMKFWLSVLEEAEAIDSSSTG